MKVGTLQSESKSRVNYRLCIIILRMLILHRYSTIWMSFANWSWIQMCLLLNILVSDLHRKTGICDNFDVSYAFAQK